MEQSPNRLIMPEGVGPAGPAMNVTEAYLNAVMAIPELLKMTVDALVEISEHLSLIGLYVERKGLSEHIISDDDLDSEEDHDEQPGKAGKN